MLSTLLMWLGTLMWRQQQYIDPEKINILNSINFVTVAWNFDVKTTTISNCFRHCRIWSNEHMASEAQVSEDELLHTNSRMNSCIFYEKHERERWFHFYLPLMVLLLYCSYLICHIDILFYWNSAILLPNRLSGLYPVKIFFLSGSSLDPTVNVSEWF